MVGCFAWALRCAQRASGGTQKMFSGAVLVRVLGVGALCPLAFKTGVNFLEGVGDVFQEDEAEDDVLVFGGVHRAAQGVGHAPQLGLMASRGAVISGLRCRGALRVSLSSVPSFRIPGGA